MASINRVGELQTKWDLLNASLSKLGDRIANESKGFSAIQGSSSDSDFRTLVNALANLRGHISELKSEMISQTEALTSDMKHFYEISRDYESEIEIFKKGRDQAFKLYDELSSEHRELLRAFEVIRDDLKRVSSDNDDGKVALEASQKEAAELKISYEQLFGESSTLKVDMAVIRKRMTSLEEENVRLGTIKAHEESDRNELIEKLSSETKSRNDALVLAEAARSELSRVLGEAEIDRLAKEAAERERDEAVGSVDGLTEIITELKRSLEEQQGLNKHEVLMRHKIETQLLAAEEENKDLEANMINMGSELDNLRTQVEAIEGQKRTWLEEKETLVNQIATLAQHMAIDKQEKENLMATLSEVKKEFSDSKVSSEDALEKAKQMERIVNQLIQDKGVLEAQIKQIEAENEKIIKDSKDVVNLQSRLIQSEKEVAELRELFEKEKHLKQEAGLAQTKAEQLLAAKNAESGRVGEELQAVKTERDSFRGNLEALQKVLHTERNLHEGAKLELGQVRESLNNAVQLKQQALSSLEAESRSKQEVSRQLEEARKDFEKNQKEYEKYKTEVAALKEKAKDDERELKSKDKELKQMSKGIDSAGQAQEKAEEQVALKNQELANLNVSMKVLSKERDAILAELQKSEKERVEIEEKLKQTFAKLENNPDLRLDVVRLEKNLSTKEAEVGKLKAIKNELEQECENLRNSLSEERQLRQEVVEALELESEAKKEALETLAKLQPTKKTHLDI